MDNRIGILPHPREATRQAVVVAFLTSAMQIQKDAIEGAVFDGEVLFYWDTGSPWRRRHKHIKHLRPSVLKLAQNIPQEKHDRTQGPFY